MKDDLNQGSTSKWRDSQNRRRIRSLFKEWDPEGMYTLKDTDQGDCKSLYRLYMALEDTTEYEFANLYFENWEHWTMVREATWFQDYLKRWRTELELTLKRRYLKEMKRLADEGNRDAIKFFATKGFLDKVAEPSRRGRPTKAEINQVLQDEVVNHKVLNDDFKRLGLQ